MKRLIVDAASRGLPVGLLFAAILAYDQGWRVALPAGVGIGLAFGLACELLDLLVDALQPHDHPSFRGETLLRSAAATNVIGNDTVRGWLYLTNQHLYFRSLSTSAQSHKWSVALADVQRSDATRTLGLISNRLVIVDHDKMEHFLINDNRGWSAAIAAAKPRSLS